MPVPVQLAKPVKRTPGDVIISAQWIGEDDDLELEITYNNCAGVHETMSFVTANTTESRIGEVCVPATYGIQEQYDQDAIANIALGSFISGAVPPSFEWEQMFVEQTGSKDFQMATGTVAIDAYRLQSESVIEIDLKIKGSQEIKTIYPSIDELVIYQFSPSTHLKCVAGAIKKEFPTYSHEYPNDIMSGSKRQDVIDYVQSLSCWL